MLDAKARKALNGLQLALGRGLGRLGLSPTTVTLFGVALTGTAAWLILIGAFWQAGLFLIAGGIFDFLDGAVARATGRTSVFGAFLDSVADRVSDGLVYSALFWALFADGREVAAALALASLVLAMLTSYLRAKAESLGFDCRVGIMERAERVVLLIIGLIFGIVGSVLWVLAAGSAVTVVQRFVHVSRQARGGS